MIELHTERLLLREFCEEDFDAYAAICADPETMRYLGDGKPLSRSQAWRSMAMVLGHGRLRGYGLWAVEELASGRCIGRIGLFNPEGWPGLEVGWLVARECQGRGFATEGGRAALAHARDALGVQRVISLIRPENAASIRVAEKLGGRFDRRIACSTATSRWSTPTTFEATAAFGPMREPLRRGPGLALVTAPNERGAAGCSYSRSTPALAIAVARGCLN